MLMARLRAALSLGMQMVSHQMPSHWKRSAMLLKYLYRHRLTLASSCPHAPVPVPSDQTCEMAMNGRLGSRMVFPSNDHAASLPDCRAFSKERIGNLWRIGAQGLVAQAWFSCRCVTLVKSLCECSQKSMVHALWPWWLCIGSPGRRLMRRGRIFSCSQSRRATDHTRFGQRPNSSVALRRASHTSVSFDVSFETGDFLAVMIRNRVDEGKETQSSLLGSQGNRYEGGDACVPRFHF